MKKTIIDLFVETGLTKSKGETRRLITSGGAHILFPTGWEKVRDGDREVCTDFSIRIKAGKREAIWVENLGTSRIVENRIKESVNKISELFSISTEELLHGKSPSASQIAKAEKDVNIKNEKWQKSIECELKLLNIKLDSTMDDIGKELQSLYSRLNNLELPEEELLKKRLQAKLIYDIMNTDFDENETHEEEIEYDGKTYIATVNAINDVVDFKEK